MDQCAVVAFPRSEALDAIEALRRRFDPLASVLPAHVTLVFPFAAVHALDSLRPHLEAAVGAHAPFEILLGSATAAEEEYIILDVIDGAGAIRTLHDRLYAGPLSAHRSADRLYRPHVTLGRLRDARALTEAVEHARAALPQPVRARIDAVALFRLQSPTMGAVMLTVPLVGR